jgi:hypothetical protein
VRGKDGGSDRGRRQSASCLPHFLPSSGVPQKERPGVRSKTRERERERERERGSDREGGTKGGREALEKLLSPPVIYLPVVCAGGLGKDEEWRRRRTRTGVSAVWSLDSTFCNMFC